LCLCHSSSFDADSGVAVSHENVADFGISQSTVFGEEQWNDSQWSVADFSVNHTSVDQSVNGVSVTVNYRGNVYALTVSKIRCLTFVLTAISMFTTQTSY